MIKLLIHIYFNVINLNQIQNSSMRKKSYSLPKVQPTYPSSAFILHEPIQTCPGIQVSRHPTANNSYLHYLDIDYGHLEKPNQPLRQFPKEKQTVENEKEDAETGRHLYKNRTDKKAKISKIGVQDEKNNKENQSNPEEKKNKKVHLRLKEIYALEAKKNLHNAQISGVDKTIQQPKKTINISEMIAESNQKPQVSKQVLLDSPIHKIQAQEILESLSSINISKNSGSIQKSSELQKTAIENSQSCNISSCNSFRSNHKVVHSRIIKTYVGGNKMQLKIINYPDNSQYMKLSDNKRKLKERKADAFKF